MGPLSTSAESNRGHRIKALTRRRDRKGNPRHRSMAIQIFGDFLGFNPHCHVLVTGGCFLGEGHVPGCSSSGDKEKLEAIFRHKVFKMVLAKGRITGDLIACSPTGVIPDSRSSTVSVYSPQMKPPWHTWPGTSSGLPSPRNGCSISQNPQRLFTAKEGTKEKIFDVLDWLAAMCSHNPAGGSPADGRSVFG